MRTQVVPRGTGPVRELPGAEPSEVDLLDVLVDDVRGEAEAPIREVLAECWVDSFLVMHRGRLLTEYYAAEDRIARPHLLQSITKSVIGCLAGILVERDQLDPEAPAANYVPDLAQGGYATTTVRELLDMRTGGGYREDYVDPMGELADLARYGGWWVGDQADSGGAGDGLLGMPQDFTAGVRAWLATMPREVVHGGPFSYRSADTEVLGWVIESITGIGLSDLIGAEVLSACGAEADGLFSLDPVGSPLAAGGLSLVPRDVLRFGWMLMDGGAVGDRQVVPARFLKDTITGAPDSVPAFRARWENGTAPDARSVPNSLYRNQFWVIHQGRPELLCLGIHGQFLVVDMIDRLAVVMLSNWPAASDQYLFTAAMSCIDGVREALGLGHDNALTLPG